MEVAKCCRMVPFGSIIAACVVIAGGIGFFYTFDKGVTEFFVQINAIYGLANDVNNGLGMANKTSGKDLITFDTKAVSIPVSIVFCGLAVAFLISSFICTFVIGQFYYSNVRSHNENCFTRFFGSPVIAAIDVIIAYIWFLTWAVVVCASAFLGAAYVVFINIANSVCWEVDKLSASGKCVDLTRLPIIGDLVKQLAGITGEKLHLSLCSNNKEIICGNGRDKTWYFIGGFVGCFIALIGIVHFLMCMSSNYSRLLAMKREKEPRVRVSPYAGSIDELKPRPDPAFGSLNSIGRVYPEISEGTQFRIQRPQVRY
ncbi:hypothetical protein L596_015280 [Steinernema carpocapsae]|uniref:Uncharacterized protein n=1 Tax=Steinernema carpocapsae TaxID=34508 RepID=A0A4U5NFI1_STECR|nr:hypothetical protein L596_015280 [Steinernema carpocapsae]